VVAEEVDEEVAEDAAEEGAEEAAERGLRTTTTAGCCANSTYSKPFG